MPVEFKIAAISTVDQCSCSISTAIRKFESIHYPKPLLPAVIAIDEFRGNAGGHKFQCAVSDPKNRKLLDILPTRNSEDLYDYFTSFSMQERMRRCFPNAKIVADKFHVCRLANWAMEAVRKEEQKKFGTHRRIYFKKSRWILLTRQHKLQADEKIQLANMLTISEPLRQAYRLKEEFYEILNSTDYFQMIQRWKIWHDRIAEANLPSFNRFMDTTL